MSSVMHPKGPLPPKVYWRRRLVLIGVVVAVIVVIVIIALPKGGSAKPGPGSTTGGASESGSPSGSPTISPTGGGACDPARVTLTADLDKTEYAAGELPQLWLTLENKSAQPCTMEIGGEMMTYVISSPSGDSDETYWTTVDCPNPNATTVPITLKPGVPVPNDKISWPRTRSTPGDCAATAPQVGADGASFDFTVTLGGLTATKRFYLF